MAGGVGSSSAGPPRSVTDACPCVRRPADNACGGGNGGSEQRHRSQVGPLRVSPCPRLAQEHPSPGRAEPQGAAEPWPRTWPNAPWPDGPRARTSKLFGLSGLRWASRNCLGLPIHELL